MDTEEKEEMGPEDERKDEWASETDWTNRRKIIVNHCCYIISSYYCLFKLTETCWTLNKRKKNMKLNATTHYNSNTQENRRKRFKEQCAMCVNKRAIDPRSPAAWLQSTHTLALWPSDMQRNGFGSRHAFLPAVGERFFLHMTVAPKKYCKEKCTVRAKKFTP